MILLACVSAGNPWGIGHNNELLIRIPNDMKRFKDTTMYHTVICGRKTLESFPGGKPLPYRNHIILSNTHHEDDTLIRYPDCPTYFSIKWRNSVDSVLDEIKGLPPEQVFLIGGSSIYEQFLNYCHEAYITIVYKTFANCNKFIPNLAYEQDWAKITESPIHVDVSSGALYKFSGYANVKKLREDAYQTKTILY